MKITQKVHIREADRLPFGGRGVIERREIRKREREREKQREGVHDKKSTYHDLWNGSKVRYSKYLLNKCLRSVLGYPDVHTLHAQKNRF